MYKNGILTSFYDDYHFNVKTYTLQRPLTAFLMQSIHEHLENQNQYISQEEVLLYLLIHTLLAYMRSFLKLQSENFFLRHISKFI
jgi:hypothetical protein